VDPETGNMHQLVAVWRALELISTGSNLFADVIRLLILTGQRRGEVAGMAWRETSDDLSTWTLPGERTKNGATHVVALSAPARDLLAALLPADAKEAGRVLAERRAAAALALPGAVGTPFAGWSKAKGALDKAITEARAKAAAAASTSPAPLAPWSVHDLRRTVATGLQRLGVRLEVTEAVLNHISGSRGGIAGVYQRHDWAAEKRAALDRWAAHVLATAKRRTPAGNVVKLARGLTRANRLRYSDSHRAGPRTSLPSSMPYANGSPNQCRRGALSCQTLGDLIEYFKNWAVPSHR
jgi:integrase